MRTFTRRVTGAMLAAALATGVAVTAAPLAALAANPECKTSETKSFKFDDRGDRLVTITLCIKRSGNRVQSSAKVKWDETSGTIWYGRFDKFEFNLRTERNDVVKAQHACYPKNAINDRATGETTYYADWVTADYAEVWSADATVRYNLDGDGLGDFLWDLPGTPLI